MKDLLYVTKIDFDKKDEIYIYISMRDLKKYAFTKKENFLLPHKDKKLLDVLNNVEGIVYQAKDNRKLTPKERLQNILGVSVTIISVYPKMSDIISYSLKKVKSYSYSDSVNAYAQQVYDILLLNLLIEKEDFLITDDGHIVVRLEDDEVDVFAARQGEYIFYFEDADEEYCQVFDKLFDYDGGRYCYANINLSDRDSIKIRVKVNSDVSEKTVLSSK